MSQGRESPGSALRIALAAPEVTAAALGSREEAALGGAAVLGGGAALDGGPAGGAVEEQGRAVGEAAEGADRGGLGHGAG